MDFGIIIGSDNFVSPNSSENKHKWCGSGQDNNNDDDDGFSDTFKMAKNTTTTCNNGLQRSNFNDAGHQQQMLSFGSPPSSQAVALPYYYQTSSNNVFGRNTGYGSAGINSGSMQGVLSSVRGPFTPSQWMELEHQALIYKYITANVPIPSYLLNPIRKALESAGISTFSGLRSNAFGWGGFHLGFSNSDPEPGRCRRTDGKKWRCSRDAVADQKYCERHINRGRHRSRKPVEGQLGHSATTNNKNKPTPTPPPSTSAIPVAPASGVANSLSNSHHLSGIPNINRNLLDKDTTVPSMASPKVSLKDHYPSIPKHHNPYEQESSRSEFGLVCSDSLLNPLNTSSSTQISFKNYDQINNKSHHNGLHQFMDDWPKNQPDIDRTQLSISTPTLEMGLGVGPVSWEPSLGGPLGEVLQHNNTSELCKNHNAMTALNFMERWDNNNNNNNNSPTGVLQRGAFGSLSNSSAGSSPRHLMGGVMDSSGLV